MLHYLLILMPPSIVGFVAIMLCMTPRSTMGAEPAETMSRTASGATLFASGNAFFLGMTANDFAAIVGAAVAILSLLINVWFKYQHLQIEKRKTLALLAEDEK